MFGTINFVPVFDGVMDAFSILVAALIGIGGLYIAYKQLQSDEDNTIEEDHRRTLETAKGRAESRVSDLERYAQRTKVVEYKYIDVLMFGPRQSGKTSIGQLWTSPWAQINRIAATSSWRKYETNLFEFEHESRNDPLFGVNRQYIPTLRLRVHDYPGEDSYRVEALSELQRINNNAVLVFIFRVGYGNGTITHADTNAEYYSYVFVEEIESNVQRIRDSISKVYVVFNKADFLPREWDEQTALTKLIEANSDALRPLKRVFSGHMEYVLTSAATNKGIIELLGRVGQHGIEPEEDLAAFKQAIQTFTHEYEVQAG